MEYLYIHSVYDSENLIKLHNNDLSGNVDECFNKSTDFQKTCLFSTASNFRQSYLLRYYILKNLLIQHNSFTFYNSGDEAREVISDKFGNVLAEGSEEIEIEKSKFVIYPIKFILGTNRKATLLGMLIKNEKGELLLEDVTSKIKLEIDTSVTLFGKGIYCLNHIVIVKGRINSLTGNFEVKYLFHPPIQDIDENISKHILEKSFSLVVNTCNINEKNSVYSESKIFSPLIQTSVKYYKFNKTNISSRNSERIETWIVLSDLHLIDDNVMTNLEKVFSGYEQGICDKKIKLGFILFGNFIGISDEYFLEKDVAKDRRQDNDLNLANRMEDGTNQLLLDFKNEKEYENSLLTFEKTRKYFNKLKELLKKFPTLENNCIFLIIPGPNDIGPDLLPKNPLTDYFTSNITKEFPNENVYLKSSPTRLYDSKHNMFLIRHSLSVELKEKTIYSYFGENNMGHSKHWNMDPKTLEQIIPPTILGQKHITSTSSNIIPTLDTSLYLLPVPDIIIIGDSGPSYSIKQKDNVWIVNPGSFKNTSSWIQYNVSSNSIDHVWL